MRAILLWFLLALPAFAAVRAGTITSSVYRDDSFTMGNITIVARIKGDAVPVGTGYKIPVAYGNSTYSDGLFLFWDGGSTGSMDRGGFKFGGSTSVSSQAGFLANTWYHIALTCSNVVSGTGYWKFYTNGVLLSSTVMTGTATGPFRTEISAARNSFGWTAGDVCGVAVFDRVLSAAEIKACYLGNPISIAPINLKARYWMPLHAQKALYSPFKTVFSTTGTLDYTKANPPLNGPQQ